MSEGLLYTRIGSLLSGAALLAIFVYQMLYNYVIENGGRYPSGGIIIISLILLTFGVVFSFCGARMLRSRIGLIVPMVGTVTLLFFIQWEWCLRYCARPWNSLAFGPVTVCEETRSMLGSRESTRRRVRLLPRWVFFG